MSKTDFQNGFALGLASGGVVEVEANVKGIIFLGITESGLPKVVDIRSLKDTNISTTLMFSSSNYNEMTDIYVCEGIELGDEMFNDCHKLKRLIGDLSHITKLGKWTFYNCSTMEEAPYMPNLVELEYRVFRGCKSLKEFKFYKTAIFVSGDTFMGCDGLTDIYCPWAEGEVANAPWGATNATIHYNWVERE